MVKTVLGSCVAVCLWDKTLHYGGINHYMLPYWTGNDLASPKYGNIAIEKLVEKMRFMGCRVEDLEAKIFGGGELIDSIDGRSVTQIGERNIEVAKRLLAEYKIPIVSSCVGERRDAKSFSLPTMPRSGTSISTRGLSDQLRHNRYKNHWTVQPMRRPVLVSRLAGRLEC